MTDARSFLHAILAEPDDDTVRLVYADWLEENGHTNFAEFVRVQIELHQLRDRRDSIGRRIGRRRTRRAKDLMGRELELWNGRQWWYLPLLDGLLEWHIGQTISSLKPGRWHAIIRRGAVESVSCAARLWAERGDYMTKAQPIRRVRLTTWPEPHVGWHAHRRLDADRGHYTHDRWPGVEFELPPPGWRDFAEQYTEIPEADLIDRMRRAMDGWT